MIDRFLSERKNLRKQWKNLPSARKEVFLVLSFIFATINFGLVVNDFLQYGEFRKPQRSTYNYTTELLLSCTLGFYLGILGFVYSCIKNSGWKFLGIFSIVWNFIVFVLRMISELVYLNFRPESFGDD